MPERPTEHRRPLEHLQRLDHGPEDARLQEGVTFQASDLADSPLVAFTLLDLEPRRLAERPPVDEARTGTQGAGLRVEVNDRHSARDRPIVVRLLALHHVPVSERHPLADVRFVGEAHVLAHHRHRHDHRACRWLDPSAPDHGEHAIDGWPTADGRPTGSSPVAPLLVRVMFGFLPVRPWLVRSLR